MVYKTTATLNWVSGYCPQVLSIATGGDVHLSHTTQTYGSSPASRFSVVCWGFGSVSAKHALPSSQRVLY